MDISFKDQIPDGLIILGIDRNPLGGVVDLLTEDQIEINNMTIKPGIDSLVLIAEVGEVDPGVYMNQASLYNLPNVLGKEILSDDPATFQINDSFSLKVISLSGKISGNKNYAICYGDTITLAPVINGNFGYQWSTGTTDKTIKVMEDGIYWVNIETICDILSDTFTVSIVGEGAGGGSRSGSGNISWGRDQHPTRGKC